MTETLPRPIAGLHFKRHCDDTVQSPASEGFWVLWNHDNDALRRLGISPKRVNPHSKNAYWIVLWAAGKVPSDIVDRELEDLQLAVFAAQRNTT